MFQSASNYNQAMPAWSPTFQNTVTFNSMFANAVAFNQTLGGWNVSKVTDMGNFMLGKSSANYSTANLDANYIGWASLPSLKTGITLNFNTIKRTAASTSARAVLTGSPNNWAITDGGI